MLDAVVTAVAALVTVIFEASTWRQRRLRREVLKLEERLVKMRSSGPPTITEKDFTDLDRHIEEISARLRRRSAPSIQLGLTTRRVWDLARFLFGKKTRTDIYEPVSEELKEDLLVARARCETRLALRWLQFCFAMRTAGLIVSCVRMSLGAAFGRLVPASLKQWWVFFR